MKDNTNESGRESGEQEGSELVTVESEEENKESEKGAQDERVGEGKESERSERSEQDERVEAIKQREQKRRNFILNSNLWLVILRISLPLILINALSFLYTIVDAIFADSAESMSSIVVIVQITAMITTMGAGLASGSVIIIARLIGRNDYDTAVKAANTAVTLAIMICAVICAIVLPLAVPILRLFRTPESFIAIGTGYFRVQVLVSCVTMFNSIFMGLEKARGRTMTILGLNAGVMLVKIGLTALFVYRINASVTMMALSTLIANLALAVYIIVRLATPSYMFRFRAKNVSLNKRFLKPIVALSFPIFTGRFIFSLGKVVINAMCKYYGDAVVGALGASNNMGGYCTNVIGSVEESAGQIISANLGNKNQKRALKAFYCAFLLNVSLACVGVIVLTLLNNVIIEKMYQKGDPAFGEMISNIFFYEKMGIIALGVNSSVLALLYGFGYTKVSLYINLSRLFVFRIPSLAIFMYLTNLGSEAVGMAMMVSNVGIGVFSLVIAAIYLHKIKKYNITDRLVIQKKVDI